MNCFGIVIGPKCQYCSTVISIASILFKGCTAWPVELVLIIPVSQLRLREEDEEDFKYGLVFEKVAEVPGAM